MVGRGKGGETGKRPGEEKSQAASLKFYCSNLKGKKNKEKRKKRIC